MHARQKLKINIRFNFIPDSISASSASIPEVCGCHARHCPILGPATIVIPYADPASNCDLLHLMFKYTAMTYI